MWQVRSRAINRLPSGVLVTSVGEQVLESSQSQALMGLGVQLLWTLHMQMNQTQDLRARSSGTELPMSNRVTLGVVTEHGLTRPGFMNEEDLNWIFSFSLASTF